MTIGYVDVPAFDVDDDAHAITGSNNLSTVATTSYLTLDQSSQPLGIHLYSVDGTPASSNIVIPDPPVGTSWVSATYVVIAKATTSETGDLTGWSPDTPDPTQLPFLMVDSSATSFNPTLDPIPVGSFGEVVWPSDDLANVLADLPANRMWLQSPTNVPIQIAYAAVRLGYELPLTASGDLLRSAADFVGRH